MGKSWSAGVRVCALVLGVVASAGGVSGCKKSDAAAPQGPPPAAVTVAKPLVADATEYDEFPGTLAAKDPVDVHARVSGMLIAADFQENSRVEKGHTLFKIDPNPFKARRDVSAGQVTQAEAKLALAKADLARGEKVAASGAISPEELDTRRANVRQAEGVLASAKGQLELDEQNLGYTEVKAEVAGRVGKKEITPGNLVAGGENGQGTLLTTIRPLDPIYCYVDADEASVLKYQRLAAERKRVSARDALIPCQIQLPDEKGWRDGQVDFVSNEFNPRTGTLNARGVFPNTDMRMLPGGFARFRVAGEQYTNAILVPDAAVGTEQNTRFVMVVGADNKVQQRTVQIGPLIGRMRVIEKGVSPDDAVIINGLVRARPGAEVKPQTVAMPDERDEPAPQASTRPVVTTARAASAPASGAPAVETRPAGSGGGSESREGGR